MRLTFFLITVAIMQVSAKGLSQSVSLNGKNLSLREVLSVVKKQTGFSIAFNKGILDNTNPVSLNVTNIPLMDFLELISTNQPVDFSVKETTIVIIRKQIVAVDDATPPGADAILPPVPVRGRVFDADGKPLAGASVFIKNSKASVSTDTDGGFSLNVNDGDILTVSFVGYTGLSFRVNQSTNGSMLAVAVSAGKLAAKANINTARDSSSLRNTPDGIIIKLVPSISALQEVVINTGYQTLTSERLTGSFSKPDMKVFTNRTSSMDVIGRLEGQIPGMIVSVNNGNLYDNSTVSNPVTGAQTQKPLLRGKSSIQLGTEPLYVVNGVTVRDFSSLNINDIADITILKDAAASAIWGSQAANGVVVVTTKSGVKNQKLNMAYNGFVNVTGKPDFDYVRKKYLSSAQYIGLSRELFDPVNFPYSNYNNPYNYTVITPSQQVLYDQKEGLISSAAANARLDSMAGIDNTQQIEDLLFSSAYSTNHTLSVSGGSGKYSFFGSLGYTDSRSYFPGQADKAYKINFTQTYSPNERFSFSLNTLLSQNVSTGKGNLNVGGDALPYQLFRDANGNNVNMPYLSNWTPEVIKNFSNASKIDMGTYKPLDEVNYSSNKNNFFTINIVGNASVKLWKGISYLGTYGYAVSPTQSDNFTDNKSFNYRRQLLNNTMPGNPPTYLLPVQGSFYMSGDNNERRWTVRNQLAYTYTGRNGNDYLSIQGGQEANETKTNRRGSTIYGYDRQLQTYPLLDYYKLSQGVPGTVGGYGGYAQAPFNADESLTRYNSYFALASYTLNRRYSLDLSWRVDHSSLFGSDVSSQNKPTYSIGGKWNMKRENFMDAVKWLDVLALRATYGIAGNSPFVGAATVYNVLYSEQIPNYQYTVIGGPASQLSSPANAKLSWESTQTVNLGIDFGIFDNRLTGTVEYYNKKTTDLLGQSPVNYLTGFTSTTSNIGNLSNHGLNIGLNSVNISTRNFTWQSGFVLGFNQNKLKSYEAPTSYQSSAGYKLGGSAVLGYSLNSLFAYNYAGLNAQGDPQVYLADGQVISKPNVAVAEDVIYKGTVTPKFNGGLTNYFNYKQFGLSMNMVYNIGAVMRADVNRTGNGSVFFSGPLAGSSNTGGNVSVDFLRRWQKPGDENITDIPRYMPFENYSLRSIQYFQYASTNVVNASYIKMNEVVLSYNINPTVLHVLKIQSAVLRFQINNILLWKANKLGIHPEFNGFTDGNRFMPVGQHSIALGASVNF